MSIREDELPKVICEEVKTLNQNREKDFQKRPVKSVLYIRVDDFNNINNFSSIKALFKYFKGNIPVCFYDLKDKKRKLLERKYWVNVNSCLIEELERRFGKENVRLK